MEVAEHIRLGQADLAGNRIERKVGDPRGRQHAARCVQNYFRADFALLIGVGTAKTLRHNPS